MPSMREIDEMRRRYYTVPDLLKMGWIIFKANIGPILIITAALYIPLVIVQELINQNVSVIQQSVDIRSLLASRELLMEFFRSTDGKSLMLFSFLNSMLEALFAPLVIVGVSKLTQSFIYEKNTQNPGLFIGFALSRLHMIILCNLVYIAAVSAGFIAFIIPGIMLLVAFYFRNYAISLSGRTGLGALKHSYMIARGRRFRILAYGLSFFLMQFIFKYFIGFSYSASSPMATVILMRYVSGAVLAFFTVPIAIWYLNMEFTAMYNPYSEETVLSDD